MIRHTIFAAIAFLIIPVLVGCGCDSSYRWEKDDQRRGAGVASAGAARLIASIENGQWRDIRRWGCGADLKDDSYYISIGWYRATVKYVNHTIDYFSPDDLQLINIAAKKHLSRLDETRAAEDQIAIDKYR